MRTKSAQAQAVIDNPSHSARVIVWVADSAGALQELTASDITYGAPLHLDTVASLTVEESVDTPRVANIALNFQQGLFSRSPLNVTGSNPLQTAAASIFVGREVLIECIVTPADGNLDLGSGCRMTLFNGYIDSTAFPENQLELVCTDRTAKLRDTWIEKERLYGFCTGAFATKGAFVYRNDLILGVGDLIVPSKLNMNGHFYRVTGGAGAIGATEPVWPTGAGAVVASGFLSLTESGATSTAGIAVETIMQQILTDNGIAETMITPVSPTWLIYPYLQGRTSVLDALKQFSTQLGWRLAFMWNAGAAAFRLTFQAPDRARITVDKAIAANDETRCSDLSIDVFGIRNVVRVTYGNAAARDNDGIPRREFVERTNAASVTKYGRRYMEVTEADTSNIDSPSEGATLAQAVVDDLAEPTVGAGIDCPIDPFVEIGDMIQLPADGRRMSSAQLLACESMRFSFAGESARSSFVVRGKPSAGRLTWLALDGKRKEKQDDIHLTTMLDSLAPSQLLASLVGGQSVKIGNADVALGGKRHGTTEHELHVSATAGFVPSPSTKRAGGAGRSFEFGDLIPGKTYFLKTVPVMWNGRQKIVGSPSAAVSFVAGRANAGHLEVGVDWGRQPLNGRFETWADAAKQCPDHWEMSANNFSDMWTQRSGDDSLSYGARCVAVRPNGALDALRTKGFIPVAGSASFVFDWRVRVENAGTGVAGLSFRARWYDRSQNFISESTLDTIASNGLTAGTWYSRSSKTAAPGPARFLKLSLQPTATGAGDSMFNITDVFFDAARMIAPEIVGDTTIDGELLVTGRSRAIKNSGASGTAALHARAEGTAQGQRAGVAFYPTFEGTGDNGPRRAADIIAGFNGGAWGAQFLAFLVGSSTTNDTEDLSNLTEVLRLTSSLIDFKGKAVNNALLSHVRARTGTAGSYVNGATITFDTEDYDTLGEFVHTTGIFTATVAGKYAITGALFANNLAYVAGETVQVSIYKNATIHAYGLRTFAPSTASWYLTSNVQTTVDLAVGDTIKMFISHNRSGGNVTLYTDNRGTYLSIDRLL